MANVFNRITKEYKKSVNTPDFPVEEWIINPTFIPDCESKYIIVEGNTIREMTVEEKAVVDYVAPIPEPLPPTAEELEKKRKADIAREIALVYSIADELEMARVALATLLPGDVKIQEWDAKVKIILDKYKKV